MFSELFFIVIARLGNEALDNWGRTHWHGAFVRGFYSHSFFSPFIHGQAKLF